jgi:outer membrane protein assembly factor BamB
MRVIGLEISSGMADLAVVPVFVNAGAALMPAIIAGLMAVVSVLLNPKKLIKLFREKPHVPVGVILVCVALYFGFSLIGGHAPEDDHSRAQITGVSSSTTPEQWVELAKKILEVEAREQAQSVNSVSVPKQGTVSSPASTGRSEMIYRGNALRNGHVGDQSPTQLKLAWAHTEEDCMFWSSPLVTADRVYGAWCYLDPPQSYGAVVCLDRASGKQLWQIELKPDGKELKGFFSSPALTADGRYLLIGQGLHPDYDSDLVCIDTQSKKVKWVYSTPLHIESSPAISGDIVVAGVGAVEDTATHTPRKHKDPVKNENPGMVIALKISTGELLWKTVVADPESSPAIEGDRVYIGSGFNGSAIVALDLNSGKQQWKTSTPYPATGAVTLTPDALLIGCGNGDYIFQAKTPGGVVMACDKENGKVLWTQDMGDAVLGAIAVKDNVAIAPVRDGRIVALDLAAGSPDKRELWSRQIKKNSRALAGPAFTGSHIYAITHDGYMFILNAGNGEEIEKHFVNTQPGEMNMCLASPMVVDGSVFVASETGGIRRYDAGGSK